MTLEITKKREAHIPGQKFEPKYDKDIHELSILELKQHITAWNDYRKNRVKTLGMELHESEFNLGEIAGHVLDIINGRQVAEALLGKENFVTAQMFIEDYDKKHPKTTIGKKSLKLQTTA